MNGDEVRAALGSIAQCADLLLAKKLGSLTPESENALTVISTHANKTLPPRIEMFTTLIHSEIEADYDRAVHAWRNPLMHIIGSAELLAMDAFGPLNAEQKRVVQEIQVDAEQLRIWSADPH